MGLVGWGFGRLVILGVCLGLKGGMCVDVVVDGNGNGNGNEDERERTRVIVRERERYARSAYYGEKVSL